MSYSRVNLESYLIPLEEINRATGNFSLERCIGSGGFGKVYKGKLSERWQSRTAAIKRLDRDSRQGEHEFRNEVEMISKFHHENIICFIGYCDENNEMIIVYEYAQNGSLDYHLGDLKKMRRITWAQRLKICIGAARGINYLHSGLGEHNRVIHRDLKSANILLDGDLVAKICDFGLSKLCPRNQADTQLYTRVAGTQFYTDPTYHESNILSKESDVYSFGVILFEMLSGMLVYCTRKIGDDRPQLLMNFVRRYHLKDTDRLIDPDIRDHINSRSFDMFKEIAYQCITLNVMERPTMDTVIERIQKAWDIQENVDILIDCVMKDMGFSYGKPLAAFTIYKWLIHYKYLEAERTTVLDRLIEIIILAIKDKNNNNNEMAYWLSNASTLLFLIQKTLKLDGTNSVWKPSPRALLLRRISMGFHSSQSSIGLSEAEAALNIVQQVEAKYPALLFKQQLTAYVENLYNIICDNLKKELGPIFALCIEALQMSERVPTSGQSFGKDSQFSRWRGPLLALCIKAPQTSEGVPTSGQSFEEDSQFSHWQGIVDRLNTLLTSLKENFVPPIIIQKIFAQAFSYIDVHLFNSILSRQECFSFSNGEYVKDGLAALELWCSQAKDEYAGSAWDELRHIRQAIRFLTMHQKHKMSFAEITNDLCPILSIQQLHRICTMSSDDTHNTRIVSQDVTSRMKTLMAADSNGTNTFLLDEDSRMPSFVDDLSTSLEVKHFVNVKLDVEHVNYEALHFLYN
ncbi:unnamed protein product [Lactuca virosa]|uniref:non-specific serine/threonine protein kinase n=1 Tax=Lactuca virosa TaxID=75947 RepID=A0AAU9NSY8_9ASTR|nr:unnamed protein product [Lactuca virosa]